MPLNAEARRGKKKRAKKKPIDLPATLYIDSATTGATVEIDGKVVGVIPLEDDFAISPGQRTIRVFKKGFSEHNDIFIAESGGHVDLEVDLIPVAGILTIASNIDGANVLVDGKTVGVTPFEGREVAPGDTMLSIKAPGYYPFMKQLQVVAGQAYAVEATLKPLPVAAGAGADGKGPTAANSVHDKWWFWTVIGLAVAGGTATALAFTLDRGQGGPSADATLTIP